MKQRLERLRNEFPSLGIEALIVGQPENRRYMSGFTGSAGLLVITDEEALLITDFRYYEQVRQQAPDFQLIEAGNSMIGALAEQIRQLGLKRVGFESHVVPVQTYREWCQKIGEVEWVATSMVVEKLREVKEPEELDCIREAVRITDEALAYVLDTIRPGMTEREVSWALEVYMRTHGAEALAFTTIVASGPRAALSHATVTDTPIEAGKPVVIDMGARYQGYCADMTRSFCLDYADDRYLQIWETVHKAQEAAKAGIRAGLSGVEVDALARDLIYGAGYEGKYGHGLGHGVGLAIHELPRASMTSKSVLQANATLTVEPGIYFPDWGGVRLEDLVVITEDGCEVLTQSPKQPVVRTHS